MMNIKKSVFHHQSIHRSIALACLMLQSVVVSAPPEMGAAKGAERKNRSDQATQKQGTKKTPKKQANNPAVTPSIGKKSSEKVLAAPEEKALVPSQALEADVAVSAASESPASASAANELTPTNTVQTDPIDGAAVLPLDKNHRPQGVGARAYVEASSGLVYVHPSQQAGGVIQEVYVTEGDRVQKGQLMAALTTYSVKEIERNTAREELLLAKENLKSSENTQVAVQKQWERNQKLISARSVSQQEFEKIEKDFIEAKINVEKMRIAVNISEQKLNLCEKLLAQSQIVAPMDGDILILNGKAGERVKDEGGFLIMADLNQMEIIAEVHETDIAKIFIGQKAQISFANHAMPVIGHVKYIASMVRANTLRDADPKGAQDLRVVEVRLQLSPEDSKRIRHFLRMHADVRFFSPEQDRSHPMITPANEARAL